MMTLVASINTNNNINKLNQIRHVSQVIGECINENSYGYSYKYTCNGNSIKLNFYSCVDCRSNCLELEETVDVSDDWSNINSGDICVKVK